MNVNPKSKIQSPKFSLRGQMGIQISVDAEGLKRKSDNNKEVCEKKNG